MIYNLLDMKKYILISICFLIVAYTQNSCNTGTKIVGIGKSVETSSNLNVTDITKIRNNSMIDVKVIYSETPKLTLRAQENVLEMIDVKISGNTLIVDILPNTNLTTTDITTVNVFISRLTSICANGSGNIETSGDFISMSEMNVDVNGSGDIKINRIECADLHLNIAGSGSINAEKFKSSDTEVLVNGSGDINIKNLHTAKISTTISGSGDVSIKDLHTETLSTTIVGSGDVNYIGNTTSHSINILGSGDINAFNLISKTAKISVLGSGDTKVFATETLDIVINGSGDVFYKGDSQITLKSIGSGKVKKISS
ncbi:DUF2807 domain-containing protein [Bacteroidales bacterium OttesenSCG-928-I21]|nr:DUF2807 domain-containing protein [Bacteroidales bacterium OttesenSCG-928-I21]